ncbi:TPA: hypothetical protein HA351_12925 [Methanosarcinaceae archaeon]|nr:hypothetical protein [Methanosarcinaceae archaeon]
MYQGLRFTTLHKKKAGKDEKSAIILKLIREKGRKIIKWNKSMSKEKRLFEEKRQKKKHNVKKRKMQKENLKTVFKDGIKR